MSITAIRHVAPEEASRRLKLRYMTSALKRWRLSKLRDNGQRQQQTDSYERLLEELQQLAMFRIDNEAEWLDELSQFATSNNNGSNDNSAVHNSSPEIAIIASRLYQAPADDSFNATLTLQELLFVPPRLANLPNSVSSLADEQMTSPAHTFANGRIHPSVKVQTQWDFASVVRASMADMYYLPPTHITELGWCLGGVINLTPIELACQLAETVFAETKAGYDSWLAAPAIQRVFGFDPNERLAQVHGYQANANEPSHTTSKKQSFVTLVAIRR